MEAKQMDICLSLPLIVCPFSVAIVWETGTRGSLIQLFYVFCHTCWHCTPEALRV